MARRIFSFQRLKPIRRISPRPHLGQRLHPHPMFATTSPVASTTSSQLSGAFETSVVAIFSPPVTITSTPSTAPSTSTSPSPLPSPRIVTNKAMAEWSDPNYLQTANRFGGAVLKLYVPRGYSSEIRQNPETPPSKSRRNFGHRLHPRYIHRDLLSADRRQDEWSTSHLDLPKNELANHITSLSHIGDYQNANRANNCRPKERTLRYMPQSTAISTGTILRRHPLTLIIGVAILASTTHLTASQFQWLPWSFDAAGTSATGNAGPNGQVEVTITGAATLGPFSIEFIGGQPGFPNSELVHQIAVNAPGSNPSYSVTVDLSQVQSSASRVVGFGNFGYGGPGGEALGYPGFRLEAFDSLNAPVNLSVLGQLGSFDHLWPAFPVFDTFNDDVSLDLGTGKISGILVPGLNDANTDIILFQVPQGIEKLVVTTTPPGFGETINVVVAIPSIPDAANSGCCLLLAFAPLFAASLTRIQPLI